MAKKAKTHTRSPVRRSTARHAKVSRRRAASPRSQTLPGFDQVRSRALDNLCEAIGDVRATMSAAKLEEAGLLKSTLQAMQRADIALYRHARVELARVPGAEKVRVRVTKEEGDAGAEDLEPGIGTDQQNAAQGTES